MRSCKQYYQFKTLILILNAQQNMSSLMQLGQTPWQSNTLENTVKCQAYAMD